MVELLASAAKKFTAKASSSNSFFIFYPLVF
ncbi:MAG: AgrD family cyclic lactone autoinducer peptide [Helicobacteraceae bacterium]